MALKEPAARQKPAGGFTFVSGTLLLSAWAAYRRGDLRLVDLRVWFACLELTARRCGAINGRLPKYRIEEVHRLIGGVGGEHVRRSLGRIETAGLLSWSESAIVFPRSEAVAVGSDTMLLLDLVPNHRRIVPVPRRIIRLIAGGARRVVVATILGHLLRCLYYRAGSCLPEGTCKSSWIADVFGVNIRNVKAARKHLVQLGWLIPVVTRQTVLNRFGQRIRVNLDWSRNDIRPQGKRSPLHVVSTTKSPPPYKDKELSSRMYMNQKPENGPSGVSTEQNRAGKPTMRHVVMADLLDPERMMALHRHAAESGLISQSVCDRLRFFAAAEHAKAIGTRNPCGLFAFLVRKKLWHFITQDDEDEATRILKRSSRTPSESRRPSENVESGLKSPEVSGLSRLEIRAIVAASLASADERLPALKA